MILHSCFQPASLTPHPAPLHPDSLLNVISGLKQASTHTHARARTHTHTHTQTSTHTRAHRHTHTHTQARTHVRAHSLSLSLSLSLSPVKTFKHTRLNLVRPISGADSYYAFSKCDCSREYSAGPYLSVITTKALPVYLSRDNTKKVCHRVSNRPKS